MFPHAILLKRALWILCGLAFFCWLGLLAWKWPFTRSAVTTGVGHDFGRPVEIGAFHPTFFPLGFTADNVRFVSADGNKSGPEVTIRKAVVTASYLDVLLWRKKLGRISISGLQIIVPSVPVTPPKENKPSHHGPPKFIAVGQIEFKDSLVEFTSPNSAPFEVTIKNSIFDNVNLRSQAHFRAELTTNEPNGTIHSDGLIGPLNWDVAAQTPLTGSFVFNQADLRTVGNMEGLLNAKGKFSGPLNHVACRGQIIVPRFGTKGGHALPLSTNFRATVNGLNGDTILNDVESRLNRTIIKWRGGIKGDSHQAGKTARLHLSVDGGRVDDFLMLFTRSQQPSMTGTINLQADLEIPPGDPGFLQKLELRGDFGMSDSRFTEASTQAPINHLSESAEGMSKEEQKEDPQIILSNIRGHVSAQNGVADLSRISFSVPGAEANMAGTYNLLDKAVHLVGTLRTTGQVSETTSGLKAGFLKLLSPFLKKRSVTVVPFKITGTAQHSSVSLDLARKQRF